MELGEGIEKKFEALQESGFKYDQQTMDTEIGKINNFYQAQLKEMEEANGKKINEFRETVDKLEK